MRQLRLEGEHLQAMREGPANVGSWVPIRPEYDFNINSPSNALTLDRPESGDAESGSI